MIQRYFARVLCVPLALWALLLCGCDSQAADLREWKPSDHEHPAKPSQGQVDVSDASTNPLAQHGVSEVSLIAWRQNCVRCHGIVGRGDGPQAAMYSPPDLTAAQRQAQLSDADILGVIKQGRGKMPGFNLPQPTLEGLVRLIRLLDASGQGLKAAQPAGAASAAPSAGSASAAPSGVPATSPTPMPTATAPPAPPATTSTGPSATPSARTSAP